MLPRFAIKVNFGEKSIITVNQGSILCAQHCILHISTLGSFNHVKISQ